MTKLIVANWKINPQSAKKAEEILAGYEEYLKANSPGRAGYKLKANVVVCPPFVYLNQLSLRVRPPTGGLAEKQSLDSRRSLSRTAIRGGNDKAKPSVKLGAQDVFWENSGAYTGEISPMMLKDLGCEYVIVGHSERRRHLGETDEMINKKNRAGLKAGLKVILCVGEPLEIRKKGKKAVEDFLENQLRKDLEGLANSPGRAGYKLTADSLIVAYEPIWAIGTGRFDTPEDARNIIQFIKQVLKAKSYKLEAKVLYGGSVNGENAKDFLGQDGIDGLLVGGASLNPDEFVKIVQKE